MKRQKNNLEDISRQLESEFLSIETFDLAFQGVMEQKQAQFDRIENRLETLLSQQQVLIKNAENNKPKFYQVGAKRNWEANLGILNSSLARTKSRLEIVKNLEKKELWESPLEKMAFDETVKKYPDLYQEHKQQQENNQSKVIQILNDRKKEQKRTEVLSKGLRQTLRIDKP